MELTDKKVLVCGMAKSGLSAAALLKKLGADVTVQDIQAFDKIKEDLSGLEELGVKFYFGKNPDEILEEQELIVVSPGIPCDLPFFKKAAEQHIPLWGEVELAYRLCNNPLIAITGTNGKTTTTALTGELFANYKKGSEIVGNIGIPFTEKVLGLEKDAYVVAEISSFQLETVQNFHPKISAVLNVTPDHLNRHKTFENYLAVKEKIFQNQGAEDFLILNYDDMNCRKMKEKTEAKVLFFSLKEKLDEGIFLNGTDLICRTGGEEIKVIDRRDLKILGDHNAENVMAVIGIAVSAGLPYPLIRDVIKNFKSLPHRIEYVDTINNVEFYNDSKGTNTDCAIKSIKAMERPVVLIGGGYDKGSDFSDWVKTFEGRVKYLVVIGEVADKILDTCKAYNFSDCDRASSLKEAVDLAYSKAEPGDCVLLSPACASWDMFDNYEQRGNLFKEFVFQLSCSSMQPRG